MRVRKRTSANVYLRERESYRRLERERERDGEATGRESERVCERGGESERGRGSQRKREREREKDIETSNPRNWITRSPTFEPG